ncbi:MAG: TolC family protein [Nitrospirae bacterium]|nr:TolC family protein [Nitrospirota bacterium]
MMRSQIRWPGILAIGFLTCLWAYLWVGEGAAADGTPTGAAPAVPPKLSWEEAVKNGVAQHPLIQAAQRGVLETEAVTKQIAAVNYPQVSGILANSLGNTRVLSNLGVSGSLPKPTNYMTDPGARVDFLITDFGRTAHKVLASKSLTASAEQQVLTSKALVILNVEQAYLACLKQQTLVAITREVLAERRLIRDQAESMYRHQLRSKLDLDLVSVEVSKAELDFIKAQNDLTAAFAALNAAMGRQGAVPYVLDDVQPSLSSAPPLAPLFKEALDRRPELLGSKDRGQAAEEALKAAQALNYGSITAIGAAGYGWWARQEVISAKGNPNNPGAQLGWWGAGFSSTTPLFTGFRIEAEIEQAQALTGEARATTKTIANDVVLQVARAYLSRLTAEQQMKVAQDRVAQAREALTLARERYKASLASILDVTTATADLLAAQTGLAEAQYGYLAGDSALAYATGSEFSRY